MAALTAISKDAVEAADVATGASQPEAKSADTDEVKADSSSDVESAEFDDPPEEAKLEESPTGEEERGRIEVRSFAGESENRGDLGGRHPSRA